MTIRKSMDRSEFSSGSVCLDSLKHFLSDRLLKFILLPASVVAYSSKHHSGVGGQGFDADAVGCRNQSTV